MKTLLLDNTTWDLVLDLNGNIALADDPYATAQDAASAIKTFLGEVWYDTSQGVPYFTQILNQFPSLQTVRAALIAAAMTVPGVTSAKCFFSAFENRRLSGQIQIVSASGVTAIIGFGSNNGGVFVTGVSILGGTDAVG